MNFQYTLCLCISLLAQTSLLAQQAYPPEKLSTAVNSLYPEFNPILSPDGGTLYFARANHPENAYGTHDTQDIWYSQIQEDGSWSEAQRMPEHLNQNRYNALLGIFNQGNSLLLQGHYNKRGNSWKKRGLSVSHKTDSGWSLPRPLKVQKLSRKSKGLFATATISDNGQYLILSFSKRYNSSTTNLFISHLKDNGHYSKPRKLRHLNTSSVEEAPFLSADGSILYFTSNLTENYQIYQTERRDESGLVWSMPRPLNDSINTAAWESYFRTNRQGSYGYFASNRNKSGADLYAIKLVEERPFILVKGRVLTPLTNEPLDSATQLSFYANGEPIDSVNYQPGEGYYEAYLPLGETYELKAQAYSHREQTAIIDGRGLIDYTEMEQDLYLEPILLARIDGNLLIRSSNTAIPSNANARILIDGKTPDSLRLDPLSNRYQLWLPYGKDYQVQVLAKGFVSEKETLKLSHIRGYEELSKNLFVDTKKTAAISGTIYDKKSGKPFAGNIPVEVILNDSIRAAIQLEGESSRFTLQLPLGASYTINAKAEGYYPMVETVDLSKEEQNVKVIKDLYLAPIEVGQSIRLNNIFFETGKANLKTESYPELDRVVTFLQENPKMKIEIAGHTDNVGNTASNKKLSAERAKSVEAYMVRKGIADDRISNKGYGSSRPEADNETELGRSLNRRVEFTILEILK